MSKAVVLSSGGLDSSTLLYVMAERGLELFPLSILYGQRHDKEIFAAREIALSLNLDSRLVDLGVLRELLPSALTGNGNIPEGHYEAANMSQTVVPGRNLIFLSVATGYAEGLGATVVAYAAHSGDHEIYPDCRLEFVKSAQATIELGYGINLLAPFINLTKADIVKEGLRLGVPYRHTWSCYNGKERPCLKCGTCIERTEAFLLNDVKDPALTSEEWDKAVKYYKLAKKT